MLFCCCCYWGKGLGKFPRRNCGPWTHQTLASWSGDGAVGGFLDVVDLLASHGLGPSECVCVVCFVFNKGICRPKHCPQNSPYL